MSDEKSAGWQARLEILVFVISAGIAIGSAFNARNHMRIVDISLFAGGAGTGASAVALIARQRSSRARERVV